MVDPVGGKMHAVDVNGHRLCGLLFWVRSRSPVGILLMVVGDTGEIKVVGWAFIQWTPPSLE